MTQNYFLFLFSLCWFIVPLILYIVGRIEDDNECKTWAFWLFIIWAVWIIIIAVKYSRTFQ